MNLEYPDLPEIDTLKQRAKSYNDLPAKPDGSLFGIAYIYDEDQDDRILVAIDQLKKYPYIIAVAESEGHLQVFTSRKSLPSPCPSLTVGFDSWTVQEFVLENR